MLSGGVSTVIPVFNRAAMLLGAVHSVLAQDLRPIEIVIVDDGSTDDTGGVCEELVAAYPEFIRVIHQENGGAGAAREAGRRIATGEFIQFLDSDDRLLPGKFSSQVEALRDDVSCGVAYGWTRLIVEGVPLPSPRKRTGEAIGTMFPSMLQSRWWDTSTPLYRASVLAAAGPIAPLRIEEDWEYDCRIASFGVRLAYVPRWVTSTVSHADNLTGASPTTSGLADRAVAHRLIFEHACAARVPLDSAEMKHYARELFLLARQCGAAGLAAESRMLFDLAVSASGPRGRSLDFRLYAAIARVLGWTATGRMSTVLDRLR